ncbi:hypothetical protein OURE66S_03507 [Oligella ureolytica]
MVRFSPVLSSSLLPKKLCGEDFAIFPSLVVEAATISSEANLEDVLPHMIKTDVDEPVVVTTDDDELIGVVSREKVAELVASIGSEESMRRLKSMVMVEVMALKFLWSRNLLNQLSLQKKRRNLSTGFWS